MVDQEGRPGSRNFNGPPARSLEGANGINDMGVHAFVAYPAPPSLMRRSLWVVLAPTG